MLTVVLLSSVIEMIQGISAIGLCELDDVVSNTIGGMLGWLVYFALVIKLSMRRN